MHQRCSTIDIPPPQPDTPSRCSPHCLVFNSFRSHCGQDGMNLITKVITWDCLIDDACLGSVTFLWIGVRRVHYILARYWSTELTWLRVWSVVWNWITAVIGREDVTAAALVTWPIDEHAYRPTLNYFQSSDIVVSTRRRFDVCVPVWTIV